MNTLSLKQFINEHLIEIKYVPITYDNIITYTLYEYDINNNIIYNNIVNYINNQNYSYDHKFFINDNYLEMHYYFFIRINKCYYLSCTRYYNEYSFSIAQFKSKFCSGNHINIIANLRFNINQEITLPIFNTVLYNRLAHNHYHYIYKHNVLIFEKLQILLQNSLPYYFLQDLKDE